MCVTTPERKVSKAEPVPTIDYQSEKTSSSEPDSTSLRDSAEYIMPKFRGREDINTFRYWMTRQLVYPDKAQKRGIEGRVVVSFVVNREGYTTDIKIISSPHHLLSDEATRIVCRSPKWSPGTIDGKPVRVRYNMPIEFVLTTD